MDGLAVAVAAAAGAGMGWAAGPLADRIGLARYGPGRPDHDPDDQALAPLDAPTSRAHQVGLAVLGAATMAALAARLPAGEVVALFGVLLLAYLVAMVVDLQYLRLPNTFTYPAALVAVGGGLLLSARLDVSTIGIWVGAIFYPAVLLLLRVGYQLVRGREGMGLGDVKLSVSLGASAGWLGGALASADGASLAARSPGLAALSVVIYAMLAGNLLGAVVGAAALRRVDREIPFGPALVAGWVLVVLVADAIVP